MIRPVFCSTIAICITIPVWFLCLGLFWSNHGNDINTTGVVLYMVILSVIGIPFAFGMSFIVDMLLNKLKKFRLESFLIIAGFHGILLIGVYLFFKTFSSSAASNWINLLIIPCYLILFLTPPSLIGCTVYFLLSNKEPVQSGKPSEKMPNRAIKSN